jgi:hypothetical protein
MFDDYDEDRVRAFTVAGFGALLWGVAVFLTLTGFALFGKVIADAARPEFHTTPDGCAWHCQDGELSPIIVDGRHVGCREE